MAQKSETRKPDAEYGIVCAGAVSTSLVGRLPGHARALGPVAGVSYRVASRIANSLKAGWPVPSFDELDPYRLILFSSSPEQVSPLVQLLLDAKIQWSGKSLIFWDCDVPGMLLRRFGASGASIARVRRCGVAGHLTVTGSAPALTFANRLIRELKAKPIEIAPGSEVLFDAAMTMGTAALTPLLDSIARILRQCGVRDAEATHMAAGLFAATATDYAHSGRQSWAWHIQEPDSEELFQQLRQLEEPLRSLLRNLLMLGFRAFDRHPAVLAALAAGMTDPDGA